MDWTRISFPSLLFFPLVQTHRRSSFLSTTSFFFVAVRSGFGWLIFRSFLNKKEKSPSPVWHHPTIHTHTHCGTYQIVIDPTDSSLFVSSSSFFSFFFHCNNFCARAGLRDPILFFFPSPVCPSVFFFFGGLLNRGFWSSLGWARTVARSRGESMSALSVFVLRLLNSFCFSPIHTYERVESF